MTYISDWRKPLLEFLRNWATIAFLWALTFVAVDKIHEQIFKSTLSALIIALVALVATWANYTSFWDSAIVAIMSAEGLSSALAKIDNSRQNNLTRTWFRIVLTWKLRKVAFVEVALLSLVMFGGTIVAGVTVSNILSQMLRR